MTFETLLDQTVFEGNENPTPEVWTRKKPPLIQKGPTGAMVSLPMPSSGYERIVSSCPDLSRLKLAGLGMVASLLWSSKKRDKHGVFTMRLVKAAALHFVDRVCEKSNPATFVAKLWDCELITRGCNINGKVTNIWGMPPWWEGGIEKITIHLTPRQFRCWNRRYEILRQCLDDDNPHTRIVRDTLSVTKPGPSFDAAFQKLTVLGEKAAVCNYVKHREKLNLTRDGDVQSNVSRMPELVRETLQINGLPVAEFDIQSAHAVLLGKFYEGETGNDWMAENARFCEEVKLGFPSIYGEKKAWKIKFLSALNQSTRVARHSSEGYRELERLFPLLARKLARMKRGDKKAVGRLLRCKLAEIIQNALIENDKDGIPSIPVVDSMVVAMPEDLAGSFRAAFRTAWRLGVPLAKETGTSPLIEGSNGENFCFNL
jgi:hypothetical protein